MLSHNCSGAPSPNTSKNSTGDHSLYQGVDEDGVVRYVGITKRDPNIRFDEHLNSIDTGKELLNYRTLDTNLSREQARILEQQLINHNGLGAQGGNLINKINSISPSNWSQYGNMP